MTMREGDGLFSVDRRVMRPRDYSAQQKYFVSFVHSKYLFELNDFKIHNACKSFSIYLYRNCVLILNDSTNPTSYTYFNISSAFFSTWYLALYVDYIIMIEQASYGPSSWA